MRSHILCCAHVHPSLRTRSSRRARQAGQTSRVPSTRSSEQIPMACVAQGSRKLQASRSAFSASGCGRVLYTHARFSPPADENEASAATAMRPAMSARTRAATIRAMPVVQMTGAGPRWGVVGCADGVRCLHEFARFDTWRAGASRCPRRGHSCSGGGRPQTVGACRRGGRACLRRWSSVRSLDAPLY